MTEEQILAKLADIDLDTPVTKATKLLCLVENVRSDEYLTRIIALKCAAVIDTHPVFNIRFTTGKPEIETITYKMISELYKKEKPRTYEIVSHCDIPGDSGSTMRFKINTVFGFQEDIDDELKENNPEGCFDIVVEEMCENMDDPKEKVRIVTILCVTKEFK